MADKLVDDLRTDARLIREHVPNEDATARVLAGTEHANKLDKAADEITRLNAENERLTKEADDLGEQANRWRNAWGESQTLVDEMREGLEQAAGWFEEYATQHYAKARTAPDGREQHGREIKGKVNADRAKELRALITKASRDSGHG